MHSRLATPAAIAFILALSTSAAAASPSRIHVIKGRVRAIDATRLVVAGSDRRLSFVVTPDTERIGDAKVGSAVDVSYHKDGKDRIASVVLVTPWKAPSSTTGSRQ